MIFKNKKTSIDKLNNSICKDSLKRAIDNINSGKFTPISHEEIGCPEISNLWNTMLEKLCKDQRKSIMQTNELLRYITEMEFIKKMIDDVRLQTESCHSIASSSEELNASVEDVSNFTESVAISSNDSRKMIIKSTEDINNAFSFVNNSFQDIEDINKQMQSVMQKTDGIINIIDIVKGIADQTNLLALNAAIEAARAGDSGRGFAVVADEVRSLAEHTKKSVSEIHTSLNELKTDIVNSVEHINTTTANLNQGKELVDDAVNSISSITEKITSINEDIIQISATVEEQSAVNTNITRDITNLSKSSDKLLTECDETGSSIFELSKLVNDVRLEMLKNNLYLSEKELVTLCISDHLLWKWKVYNMLLGYDKIDINSIGTHTECRLGQWYYGEDGSKLSENIHFKALEEPHIKLHELAKDAVQHFDAGNISLAEKSLQEMGECSKKVVQLLNKIMA